MNALSLPLMDNVFQKAKSVDLFHYMGMMGYKPVRYNDRKAYFISPKRQEKNPSFEVDRIRNTFADWGEDGAFGDPVDFIVWMNGCTNLEAAHILLKDESIPQYHKPPLEQLNEKNIEVLETKEEITNESLIEYVEQVRKVPISVVNEYCQQVLFQFPTSRSIKHYGIALPNDKGGYAIRNTWFRGAVKPAGISTVHFTGGVEIMLFEGFMDWLSFIALYGEPQYTAVVVNSLIFIPMMIDVLRGYDKTHLWVDNDPAADSKVEYLLVNKIDVIDHRGEFDGYNDLNEKLQAEGDV